ncbi:uncharacterized protein [Lolium perenne]|uniref:uncharacterized protein isoform X2 n=1 Tax=Lolium perenne TaxID=4522 RepID=UPI0021F6587B|nr:uncharacterized protein LOC127343712 [Lolium perenne]
MEEYKLTNTRARCSRDGAHRCGIAMVSGNIPCRVQIKNLQHLSVGSLEPQRLIETRAMKYSLLFLGQIVGCQRQLSRAINSVLCSCVSAFLFSPWLVRNKTQFLMMNTYGNPCHH